ncbi:hydrolase [Kitasatospora sp. NE20-6]|uniref:isochorismatase family protein n=1 Tax=Kitasatospora sp. NE20-6 TaxID=2859066 RepID=UPI0034DB99EE
MTVTTVDPTAALLVIDLQNGIRRLPYVHPLDGVVANAAELAAAFRRHGLPVVLTTVTGTAAHGRTDVDLTLPPGLPAGWQEPVAELAPAEGDHRIGKQRWGAFTGTGLEARLRSLGVTQVVLTGVATCFGVESTARQAAELGFHVTLATDAMTDRDADAHAHSVTRVFPLLGECRTTRQILRALDPTDPTGA